VQYLAQYREVLEEQPGGLAPSPDGPLALARQAASEALAEYERVLRVFTELTVHGRMPKERAAKSADGRDVAEVNLISIVDNDESILDSTRALLRSVGYEVVTFPSAESFLDSGAATETKCLILDVRMPGLGGLELQRRLKASGFGVPIIFVSAHDDRTNRQLAINGGAVEFLGKPFAASALLAAVQAALGRNPEPTT
jgi:CheY-like chemotaxis protein